MYAPGRWYFFDIHASPNLQKAYLNASQSFLANGNWVASVSIADWRITVGSKKFLGAITLSLSVAKECPGKQILACKWPLDCGLCVASWLQNSFESYSPLFAFAAACRSWPITSVWSIVDGWWGLWCSAATHYWTFTWGGYNQYMAIRSISI